MYFNDLVNVSSNNPIIYILFVFIIAILLLLYLQNREMRENMNNSIEEDKIQPVMEEVNNDNNDLQSISKELEQLPKEHNVDMTQYEMEQEKTAIISYDELLKQSQYEEQVNDFKPSEELDNNYQHEEAYLAYLKQLKENLN